MRDGYAVDWLRARWLAPIERTLAGMRDRKKQDTEAPATSLITRKKPETDFVNTTGIELIRVEPGTFMMGNPRPRIDGWDEQPVHRVTITVPLWIAQKEVTVDQFRRFRPGFGWPSLRATSA